MSSATTSSHEVLRDRGVSLSIELMSGCLYALILLNLVQLAAGLAGVDPRPPAQVLPMIAATAALGLIAVPLVSTGRKLGYWIGIAFCFVSMVGMGPHKLFMESGTIIAPVALLGFVAEIAFIWNAVRLLRK